MKAFKLAIAGLGIFVSGCQTLPQFNNTGIDEQASPKVSDITNEVQCEINFARTDATNPNEPELADLQNGQYVANINLTLDITDNQAINPALNIITPYSTSGTNFTGSVGGQVSGQQHRNYVLTFTLVFDKNTPIDLSKCHRDNQHLGLRGDLGIEEVLRTGLKYDTDGHSAYALPAIGVNTTLGADPLTGSAALMPTFGSTIDFQLIYGITGGPNWTLTKFTGPNPSSGGLVNLMRTNKDTLVLAFARVGATAPPAAGTGAPPSVSAAAHAAQDSVTRQILQRLIVP